MKLKVMTFNIMHAENFLTGQIDYDSIINLIKKYDPDIISLNELYGKGFDKKIKTSQLEYIATKLGLYYYFGKATYLHFIPYGNGLLSKYPINKASTIKIKAPFIHKGGKYYENRSIIKANININNKKLTILSTHLGLNEDEQVKGIKRLENNLPNSNYLILGDLNMDYDNPLLNKLDFATDTATYFKKRMYSWPSDKPKYKYDYILTSKDIKIISAIIPKEIISDHRPYIADIEI